MNVKMGIKDRILELLGEIGRGVYEKETELRLGLLAALAGESVILDDYTYRKYIFVKALFNLTNSSLHSINFFCGQLISSGVRVLHTDTMVLTVLVTEIVDPQALQAFLNLRWSPTGVGVKIYYVLGPVFGFNGSGLHPFNQAPFVNGGPQDLDV